MQDLNINQENMKNLESVKLNQEESKKMSGFASIDKPWLQYYDRDFDISELPKMSIYQLAYERNKYNLKDTAIDIRMSKNNFTKGICFTYDEYFKRIRKSAKSSLKLGIKEDEIVPIILPNIPEARIMIYSNNILGAISYPISPLMPASQLELIIKENGIKNLVIFSAFYEKYANVLKDADLENVIYLDGTESLPKSLKALNELKAMLNRQKKNIPNYSRLVLWDDYDKLSKELKKDINPLYHEDKVAAIIGTSGTTGTSKGVCLTNENINASALAYINGKCFDGNFMDALIPSIGYGISMLHYQTVAGKKVYLIPELITDRIADAVCKIKPDNFPGGPVHYINLANSKAFKEGRLPKAQNMISGGASLPENIESTLNGVGTGYEEEGYNPEIYVRQGFGLSENVATGTYSKHGAYKFGSVGIPVPYETIGIFKPGTDEELMYGEQGEICITGPTVMKHYLNNPIETDKVIKIHRDGRRWIHTKDIGYMDENGHIFHVERIKNIFMRTGFNVHPSTISEFINTLPFVKNSYVMGFDHPKEQSVPIAFVVINENTSLTKEEIEKELREACFSNLEETSVPFDFVFVDELPVNLGGKIDGQIIKKVSEIDLLKNDKVMKKTLNFK